MNNDQIIGAGGTFCMDMRDGTIEQHLSNGEVRVFPPTSGSGKTVLSRQLMAHDAQHTAIMGATRDGMSMSAFRSRDSGESCQPVKKGSRLLGSLLSRQ